MWMNISYVYMYIPGARTRIPSMIKLLAFTVHNAHKNDSFVKLPGGNEEMDVLDSSNKSDCIASICAEILLVVDFFKISISVTSHVTIPGASFGSIRIYS